MKYDGAQVLADCETLDSTRQAMEEADRALEVGGFDSTQRCALETAAWHLKRAFNELDFVLTGRKWWEK